MAPFNLFSEDNSFVCFFYSKEALLSPSGIFLHFGWWCLYPISFIQQPGRNGRRIEENEATEDRFRSCLQFQVFLAVHHTCWMPFWFWDWAGLKTTDPSQHSPHWKRNWCLILTWLTMMKSETAVKVLIFVTNAGSSWLLPSKFWMPLLEVCCGDWISFLLF